MKCRLSGTIVVEELIVNVLHSTSDWLRNVAVDLKRLIDNNLPSNMRLRNVAGCRCEIVKKNSLQST